MPATTYSIHAAFNHGIVATATVDNLQQVAQQVAQEYTSGHNSALRFYVHNGLGVIAAFMARNGTAHNILRNDYLQFNEKAREQRTAENLSNY